MENSKKTKIKSEFSGNEKIKISKAILVEGKYDKIRLERLVDAHIFATDGFGVFSASEKSALLRRIAETKGLIVLTDSDPAGFVIRNKLKGMLPKENVIHIYAPVRAGKESRKSKPSKAGILGVEGLDNEVLASLFEKAGVIDNQDDQDSDNKDNPDNQAGSTDEKMNYDVNRGSQAEKRFYKKSDLYAAGLCGGSDSASKREKFCRDNDLPPHMTPNALLEAVNLLNIPIDITDITDITDNTD